jgi:hypothetical protein
MRRLLIMCSMLLVVSCTGTSSESVTTMTLASATTAPATEPTPIMEGWHRVSATDGELGPGGGGGLETVIEGGPGLMAFGEACRLEGGSSVDCHLGVWGSVDGTQWQQLADLGSADFFAVATLGTLVVVGGSSCSMREQERGDECGPALWTSTDGVEWSTASSDDQVFVPYEEYGNYPCLLPVEGIVELPSGGLLAYGCSGLGFTTWLSQDGLVWELGRFPFPSFVESQRDGLSLDQILVRGDNLVAFGTQCDGTVTEGFCSILMATSSDGEEWTQLEPPLVSDGNAYFSSLVTEWSGGLAALAEVCDQEYNRQDLLLTSTDGISWQTQPLDDVSSDITFMGVHGFGSGLLVGGSVYDEETGEGRTAFGISPDGDTWTLYQADPDVIRGEYLQFNDIIEFGDLTVAVGSARDPEIAVSGPAVWWYSG